LSICHRNKRSLFCFILLLALCLVARGVIPTLTLSSSPSGKPKPRGRAIVQCQAHVCKENVKKQGLECASPRSVSVPAPTVVHGSPVPPPSPALPAVIVSSLPARAPPLPS
jgi:hypothetical protein